MDLDPDVIQASMFVIHFIGEEAEDLGGPTREWFTLISQAMTCSSHAYFTSSNEHEQTYQPNPIRTEPASLHYFEFFGRFVAMAINSCNFINIRLTTSLLKQILNQPIDMQDLRHFDPELYAQFERLRTMTDPAALEGIFFTIHIAGRDEELLPGGSLLPLMLENMDQYIALMTQARLFRSIESQLTAFFAGFESVVHMDCIQPLNARALEFLLNGADSLISVNDWQRSTLYDGYEGHEDDMIVITWFWNVVCSFSPEQQVKLLRFVTGSPNVPVAGFSALTPMFTIKRMNQGDEHMPSAATCIHVLNLPIYTSESALRNKLLYAIEEGNEGFGFI